MLGTDKETPGILRSRHIIGEEFILGLCVDVWLKLWYVAVGFVNPIRVFKLFGSDNILNPVLGFWIVTR